MASAAGQLRALNGLQSGSPRDLAIGIDTEKGEIDPATAAASPDRLGSGRQHARASSADSAPSTAPDYMLSHERLWKRCRYGRSGRLTGSSYAMHIMPKASAQCDAQSCSGPRYDQTLLISLGVIGAERVD